MTDGSRRSAARGDDEGASLEYVFLHTCLSAAQVRYISAFLADWTGSRGLLPGHDKFVSLIVIYLKHCCPDGTDEAGLRLLGKYLVLYYELYVRFHDPRWSTASYAEMIAALFEALRGEAGRGGTPFEDAALDLRADIESYNRAGLSERPFLGRLREMFDAFLWNRDLPPGLVAQPDVFWQKRIHLVSQLPYVELCDLVVGNHTENIAGEVEPVDTLAAEITFLANEVGSMKRDFASAGRQNLVKSFVVHERWSLEDTLARFVTWHNEKQSEMRRAVRELATRSAAPSSLVKHAEIQEIVTHGCFHSMLELRDRYAFTDGHLKRSAGCCRALYFSGSHGSSRV